MEKRPIEALKILGRAVTRVELITEWDERQVLAAARARAKYDDDMRRGFYDADAVHPKSA